MANPQNADASALLLAEAGYLLADTCDRCALYESADEDWHPRCNRIMAPVHPGGWCEHFTEPAQAPEVER